MSTPETPSEPNDHIDPLENSHQDDFGITRQAPVVTGTEPGEPPTFTKSSIPETVSQPVYEPSPSQAATSVPPYNESYSPATESGSTMVDDQPAPRTTRMRTVVLGLVLLVIAGVVLIGQLTEIKVDGGAVLLALMIGGGLLLIAGARRS